MLARAEGCTKTKGVAHGGSDEKWAGKLNTFYPELIVPMLLVNFAEDLTPLYIEIFNLSLE